MKFYDVEGIQERQIIIWLVTRIKSQIILKEKIGRP